MISDNYKKNFFKKNLEEIREFLFILDRLLFISSSIQCKRKKLLNAFPVNLTIQMEINPFWSEGLNYHKRDINKRVMIASLKFWFMGALRFDSHLIYSYFISRIITMAIQLLESLTSKYSFH